MANELLLTTKGTVTFPQVFTPASFNGGKAKYSINLLFSESDMADPKMVAIKKAVKELAIEKWGEANLVKKQKAGLFVSPFKSGEDKAEKYPIYEGKTILSASTQYAPSIVDASRQEIIDPSAFYGGCEARIAITLYAWEYLNKYGIGCNVNHIQKLGDGDKLGSAKVTADDVFSDEVSETASKASTTADEFDI